MTDLLNPPILPRIVNKTVAARRLGICTTTLTLILAKKGAPQPVHNNLYDYKAIELFLDKTSNADRNQPNEGDQEYWNELARKRNVDGKVDGQISRH